ncbi:MAG: hypothetical protein ACI9KE_005295 [Polyangiales bacterium]|jgi:hypothetical protein
MTRAFLLLLSLHLIACGDENVPADDAAVRTDTEVATDAGVDDAGADAVRSDAEPIDAGMSDGSLDSAPDAALTDRCEDARLCERFDDYADVTSLEDGQRFGPWRTAHRTPGSVMDLDDTRSVSGGRSLHVRIDDEARAGGRLFTTGDQPLFEDAPTQLYGRMMMYVGDNGHSVHWTMFGASGPALDVPGRRATYLFSSLRRADANQFSAVNYVNNDPAQDCWNSSDTPIPSGRWMCIEWSADSVTRQVRMSMDGSPILAVDETGQGCVGDVPNDSPWFGPTFDQFYVGTWSFHPMVGPLEVWIDDVIVDTTPVACP